jgi:hypothetical protein
MPKKKALVATGNSLLTIYHALLSDPQAPYAHLGTDYYQRRTNIRRQARNYVRGLERLGYKVTIEPIDPPPENSKQPQANPPAHLEPTAPPPAAAARPAVELLSDQAVRAGGPRAGGAAVGGSPLVCGRSRKSWCWHRARQWSAAPFGRGRITL